MPDSYVTRGYAIALLAACTMAVNGYDSSVFNSVQGYTNFVNYYKREGETKINPNILGAVNTAYGVGGIVVGMLITPTVSQRFGRKFCIQLGCAIVIISAFVQAFAPNMEAFIAGRLIMGMGQGFAVSTGPTYVAEVAPPNVRGTMMSFWQIGFGVGACTVYWTAYATQRSPWLGLWQFRVPILMQVVFPSIVVVGFFFCPESPRWLVEKERYDRARSVLSRVRAPEDVQEELDAIVTAVQFEKASLTSKSRWYTPYITLFKEHSLRRRAFIILFINIGQQTCGNGMLASYSTLIYQRTFGDANTIFLVNGIYGTLSILFTLSCTLFVDRWGRRTLFLLGAAGQGISLLIISIVGATTPENPDKTRPYGIGIAVAALFHVFAVFYKPTWGATTWVYTSEIFSTDVRAHGVAIAAQTQSVISTILNQFFPLFLAACGFYTFFFFAGINIILFAGVWFFVPETRRIPLEEIDQLFGGTNHKEAGQALEIAGAKAEIEENENKDVEVAHPTVPVVERK